MVLLENRAIGYEQRFALRAAFVARRELTTLDVGDHDGPQRLAFTDEERIGVQRGFVRDERCVNAAHHDRDAARPELLCDLVRARRLRREGRDTDEIRVDLFVVTRSFALFVDQFDVPMLWRRRGDVRQRERLPQIVAVQRDAIPGIDENELHAAVSMTARSRPTVSKIWSARSSSSLVCSAE